ncbi:hypothetical protein [Pelobacter seleniigenes]|uniref:hypothetical protein n=1 Tax=Pelobacter seleniigenes TaxID=407188 RepID=UPI0004A76CD8|nr:hypothetical protein [Pelobacter seleniigenes]
MFGFLILLLVLGGGFYFYQRLKALEAEIRAEQATATPSPSHSDDASPKAEPARPAGQVHPLVVERAEQTPASAEEIVLAAVRKNPGLRQTDLYGQVATLGNRQLQVLLKEMAEQGRLQRKKQGSSYLLFPE